MREQERQQPQAGRPVGARAELAEQRAFRFVAGQQHAIERREFTRHLLVQALYQRIAGLDQMRSHLLDAVVAFGCADAEAPRQFDGAQRRLREADHGIDHIPFGFAERAEQARPQAGGIEGVEFGELRESVVQRLADRGAQRLAMVGEHPSGRELGRGAHRVAEGQQAVRGEVGDEHGR